MKKINQKGITLIALVVTIIVLLILAAVSINLLLGNYGIITKTKEASDKYGNAINSDYDMLNEIEAEIENHVTGGSQVSIPEESKLGIEVAYRGTTSLKIKINKVVEDVQKYVYQIGSITQETTDTEITVDNLDADTNYSITVKAIKADNTEITEASTAKTEKRIYLYNNGNTCDSITGGWAGSTYPLSDATSVVPTVEFNTDNIHMSLASSTGSTYLGGFLAYNNEIDLSKYKKIGITYTGTLGKYASGICVSLVTNHKKNYIDMLVYTAGCTTKTTKVYDISSMKNLESISIYIQSQKPPKSGEDGSAQCNIYEIWLEK